MRYGLPRALRLRKRREYLAIQGGGRKIHSRHFVILVAASGEGRLGITVSSKIGNAVTRNRLKRLVREFVRQARDETSAWLPADRDVVVIAKRSAAGVSFHELRDDLLAQSKRVSSC